MRAAGGIRTALPIAAAALVVATLLATPVQAQYRLTVGLLADRSTYNEFQPSEELAGYGAAGQARFESGAWAVEGDLSWRSVSPSVGDGDSVTLIEGGGWARYRVWRTLSAEVGFRSRTVDPEFAAQDVGMALAGLHYQADLTSLASLWIRGSAIPWSTFNGGGDSGVGVGLGLGVRMGPAGARWRGVARYDFQRIDRTVRDVDVPIQLDGFRLGVEVGVF